MNETKSGINPQILVIYGLGVMAAMTVSESVTELGKIAAEFHPQAHSLVGLVMSMPSLIVAIGALAAGWVVDRQGDRPVLFAGAVFIIIGDLWVTAAPDLHDLLLARAVDGLGYVLTSVAAITMLIRITRGKQRTTALTLWSTFVPASFLLPFLTAGLANAIGTWRAAFFLHLGLTAALLILGALLLPGRTAADFVPSRTRGILQVLRAPLPYLLGLSFGADAFLQSGVIASLAPYLAHRYHTDPNLVQQFNSGAMILNMVGCLSVGALLNRGIRAPIIGLFGIVVTAVPVLALYALPLGLPTSIAMSWVFMFGSGFLVGMWALVPFVAPSMESLGATSGMVTQITLLGVLASGPAYFASLAAPGPGQILTVTVIGLVLCLAGLPVWLRVSAHKATLAPLGGAHNPDVPPVPVATTARMSR